MKIGEAVETFLLEKVSQHLRPVGHADVVVTCPPAWVRASGAEFFFGIKREFLNGLVAAKKVCAKKADRIVLYRYADIDRAIAEMRDFGKGN